MEMKKSRNNGHNTDPASPPASRMMYIPLTDPDVGDAAKLYTEVFVADEPTTCRSGVDPATFLPYARSYVGILVRKDLSFVVRDPVTGKLGGFIFCFDLTDNLVNEGAMMIEFLAHFPATVALIDELEDRFLDREGIKPGSVLHIFQIGVSRDFRCQGIAQEMICRVTEHARRRGFRQLVADCTSPASSRTFARCGFREAGSISYSAFSVNGDRFFAGLDEGISLMVRDI